MELTPLLPAGLSINATTGQVTPSTSTTGSYTITYSYVSGCAGTATTTMLVGTGPTVTTSATPSSVCSGQNALVLASAVGSGNYTYNSIAYSALTPSGSPTVLYSTYTLDASLLRRPCLLRLVFMVKYNPVLCKHGRICAITNRYCCLLDPTIPAQCNRS